MVSQKAAAKSPDYSDNKITLVAEAVKGDAATDFRQPRISTPPAESGDRQHTPHGLAFQGGRVVWLLGSWMSYQRCAVLKYKQC